MKNDWPGDLQSWTNTLAEKLRGAAARMHYNVPDWQRLVVTAEANGERTGDWMALEDAEPLFSEAVTRANLGPVSIVAEKVRADALHLVIEYSTREGLPGSGRPMIMPCWKSAMMVRDQAWKTRIELATAIHDYIELCVTQTGAGPVRK